jgi:hypothetical protein
MPPTEFEKALGQSVAQSLQVENLKNFKKSLSEIISDEELSDEKFTQRISLIYKLKFVMASTVSSNS